MNTKNNYISFIGIDPGKDGGVVRIWNGPYKDVKNIVETFKIPLLANKDYDIRGLIKILTDLHQECPTDRPPLVLLEDVHSIRGSSAKSNFSFGYGVGLIRCAVVSVNLPFVLIGPKKWQKVCFEGIRTIEKVGPIKEGFGKVDTKKMSQVACERLYPGVNLLGSERSKVAHKGIVDALLIAHYGRVTY